MFDQGSHVVLKRDDVCVILKTPVDEMPQVEYWGRDFGMGQSEPLLGQLDAMTLKVTPPQEKPDAALRPSLLPQGAEAFAGRPGLEAYRGAKPVFARWTTVNTSVASEGTDEFGTSITITAEDAVNKIRLELTLALQHGGLILITQTHHQHV